MDLINHSLHQVTWQHFFTDGLLCQCQPKLTGLQGHILIGVLSSLQHVLQEKKGWTKKWFHRFKKWCEDTRGMTENSMSSVSSTFYTFLHKRIDWEWLPGWCCAYGEWDGRCGPPVTWPELCTHSYELQSLHLPPVQTDSDEKHKKI